MTWFRFDDNYFENRKTKRLMRRLGRQASDYPIRLWAWASKHSETGLLRDLEPAEIAEIAQHDGDPQALVDALVDLVFLEYQGEDLHIHGWAEMQKQMILMRAQNRERSRRFYERRKKAISKFGVDPQAPPRSVKPPAAKPATKEREAEIVREFEILWGFCARKVSKGQALRAYSRLRLAGKMPPLVEVISKLVLLQRTESWSKDNRTKQPHLATWLNRDGWLDEIPAVETSLIEKGYWQREEDQKAQQNELAEIRAFVEKSLNGEIGATA